MSDNAGANGCMGCLGLGCATYILLSLLGLIMYWWGDNPQEKAMNSTFQELIEAELRTTHGTLPYGIDRVLIGAKSAGVEVDQSLEDATEEHSGISNIKIDEERLGDKLRRVKITMDIAGKSPSGKPSVITCGLYFLIKPKAFWEFRNQSEIIGIESLFIVCDGLPKYMDIVKFSGTTANADLGFEFLAGLFKNDEEKFNKTMTTFIGLVNKNKQDSSR